MLSAIRAGASAAEYLPVNAAADVYSRRVNAAESSALCGCWRLLRGDLLVESSCVTGEVVTV